MTSLLLIGQSALNEHAPYKRGVARPENVSRNNSLNLKMAAHKAGSYFLTQRHVQYIFCAKICTIDTLKTRGSRLYTRIYGIPIQTKKKFNF